MVLRTIHNGTCGMNPAGRTMRVIPTPARVTPAPDHGVYHTDPAPIVTLLAPAATTPVPEGRSAVIPAVLTDHLRWMRLSGLAATTIAHRRRALQRIAAFIAIPLLAATAADLYAWRASLTGLADVTVAAYVSHVRSFYDWAAGAGLIQHSPAARLPVPSLGRRLPRPISTDDLYRAIAAAAQPVRLWLVLICWCGLRCKEIALLRRDSIRETAAPPVVLITSTATKGRAERVVPLGSFAVAEIRAAGLPPSGWAFTRRDGQPGPNTPARVSEIIAMHLHGLGIAATAHQGRHWFGTETYRASHDLRIVQELLGHASPVTTSGYADWDKAEAAATVAALPVPVPAARLRAVP